MARKGNGTAWLVVFVAIMGVLLFLLLGAGRAEAQAVPTYSTQLLVTTDSIGLEVTWARDPAAITWGHVAVENRGDAGTSGGIATLPTWHAPALGLSGVDTVWFSLAGMAGRTFNIGSGVQVLYATGVTRRTYPFPGQWLTYLTPVTAPPAPPPTYVTYAPHPATLLVWGIPGDCPISIVYSEDPAHRFYTITPAAAALAACGAPVLRLQGDLNGVTP